MFEESINEDFITLGRKAFSERYKLNIVEIDRLKRFIERLSKLEDRKTKRQIAFSNASCFVYEETFSFHLPVKVKDAVRKSIDIVKQCVLCGLLSLFRLIFRFR